MAGGLEPYVERGFLDRAACARIREAMDRGRPEAAEILQAGHGIALDTRTRHACYVEVDAGTLAFVEGHLESRRSRLAAWFGRPLASREGAGFVRYPAGGFYRPHRDRGVDETWPGAARRQVALVVFLTAGSGGALRLLDEKDGSRDIDIRPEPGVLVAFPADTLHEVARVEGAPRDVVVDWFY